MLSLQIAKIFTLSLVSFFFALGLGTLWQKFLVKYRLGKNLRTDAPIFAELHKKKAGTPTMGGGVFLIPVIVISLGLFAASLVTDGPMSFLNFLSRKETYLPLGALIAAALVGGLDDLMNIFRLGANGGGIGGKEKLVLYTAISVLGAWWFYFKLWKDTITIPFFGPLDLGLLYFPYAAFVILACTLSLNEADGLDGLSSGITVAVLAALGLISFLSGQYMLTTLIGVLTGALIGFMWYNIYPAKFFMGDLGSTALGIFLGVTTLMTDTSIYLLLFAPILVLESLSVILQVAWVKIFKKKLFLLAPIHHHFEAVGIAEPTIVMRMWLVSILGAAVGVMIYLVNLRI